MKKEHLHGLFRATVKDNDDPLKRGRILISIPSLVPSEEPTLWAESCLPPDYFSIPRVGEYVWIMFEEGDIQLPVWMGIFPTRDYVKDKMAGFGDRINYDPNIIRITGKYGGITIHDNDTIGDIKISISDSVGNEIELNTNSASLNITGGNSLNGGPTIEGGIRHRVGSSSGIGGSPKPVKPMEVERY